MIDKDIISQQSIDSINKTIEAIQKLESQIIKTIKAARLLDYNLRKAVRSVCSHCKEDIHESFIPMISDLRCPECGNEWFKKCEDDTNKQ